MIRFFILIFSAMTLTTGLWGQGYGWVKITGENQQIKEVFCRDTILYATTNTQVYCSTNHGSIWQLLKEFPGWISVITVDDKGVIYCHFSGNKMTYGDIQNGFITPYASNGLEAVGWSLISMDSMLFLSGLEKVYRSDDLGANWTSCSDGLPTYWTYSYNKEKIYSLYSDGVNLFAGTHYNGLYFSDNEGQSWRPRNNGIPESIMTSAGYISSTEVDYIYGNDERIFISTNKGAFSSDNLGLSWSKIEALPRYASSIPMYLHNNSLLYLDIVARPDRIYLSQDNGDSWHHIDTDIRFDRYIVDEIITADDDNFYMTNSLKMGGGITRFDLSDSMLYEASYGLSHNQSICLYISGSRLFSATSSGGLYISDDLGQTFRHSEDYLMGYLVNSLISNDSALFAATDKGMMYSLDLGNNWEVSDTSSYTKQSSNLVHFRGKIYCTMKGEVYQLSDDSNTWGKPAADAGITRVNYLCSTPDELYACTADGVYYLDTLSQVWIHQNSYPEADISSMAVMDTTVYLGSRNIIYHSSDNGASWTPYPFEEEEEIRYLAFVDDNILAAATKGIYQFSNQEWQLHQSVSYYDGVNYLLVDDSTTYAATMRGIYKASNKDVKNIIQNIIYPDQVNCSVYPNPASDFITIELGHALLYDCQLAIYDQLGRLVYLEEGINRNQIIVDVSEYMSGLYFYKLQNEGDRTYSSGQFVVE